MSLGPFAIAAIVPPLNLVPLGLAGVALAALTRWRRLGLAIAGVALALLLVLALPFTGGLLIASLERGLPLIPPADDPPRAIVVLAAEVDHGARDPGASSAADDQAVDLGPLTVMRLRAAAALARRTGLPVLVSGGKPPDGSVSLAALMAESLRDDFGVPTRWREDRSDDTWENASDSAAILRREGIGSVYLVTHAWHMPRALIAFRHAGLRATAAPVLLDHAPTGIASDFAPRLSGWRMSFYALHEWIGCLYYAWRR
jgi:uncharacterized SAM-binding protein YcdF (DUF218 family)